MPCRLCGGGTEPRFSGVLLERIDVRYHECRQCGSLQTDQPTWLDQAYGEDGDAIYDTGAVHRCERAAAAILLLRVATKARGRLLDFGGGAGLLCRMLRDTGADAWTSDKYVVPVFAMGFEAQLEDGQFDIVSAIEVIEHFHDPREALDGLLSSKPKALLVSTELYEGQGPEWWYLSQASGQHVFFYSWRGLSQFAGERDYALKRIRNLIAFVRKDTPCNALFFNYFALQIARSLRPFLSGRGAGADFNLLMDRGDHLGGRM